MIVDAIMKIVVAVFTGILGLIPAYELPASVTTLGEGIGSAIAAANGVFPVVVLGACLGIMLGVRLFIAGFSLVVWLYSKIPMKFT